MKEKNQQDITAFEKWQNTPDPEDEFLAIHVALLLSREHAS